MTRFRHLAAALLLALAGTGGAETLSMDDAAASRFLSGDRPSRGMTMQKVESGWGQPAERRAAVGDPPITRWVYPEFIVYFEYDRVIHAVLKRPTS